MNGCLVELWSWEPTDPEAENLKGRLGGFDNVSSHG